MKINFVGIVVDSHILSEFEAASVAGNKMQLGIIKGLYSINNETKVTSSYPYKMHHFKKNIFISGGETTIGDGIKSHYIPYINIIFLKQITLFLGYLIELLLWCKENNGDKALVVYNTLSYVALPVIIVGKLYKCKTFCVVADLPITSIKKSIIQRLEDRMETGLINKFDGLIPLTKYIQKDFAPNTPSVIIEAGFENVEENKTFKKDDIQINNVKNIVFTGTLNCLSGIELLLDAFSKILSTNINLHIYGSGNKEDIVRKYITADNRIYYHGKVSNNAIIQIQKNADLLVSPRFNDDNTTKYTFPSKILEYITSGKPVLSNKLLGIPSEYDELINFVETSNSDEWSKMITRILFDETDYYKQKAQKAKLLVMKNKTWLSQTKKIYNFMSGFYR